MAEVEAFAADVRIGRRPPEDVEEVLRHAQRDPALRPWLARSDGSWVNVSGRATDDVAADLAGAGWVPIEVSRLRLVLTKALAEVEASRSRLAEATATERKRLERDLHDGVRQRLERDLHDGVRQRLVATGMRLRSLQRRVESGSALAGTAADVDGQLDAAVAELTVLELRRLAHGVRPSRRGAGGRPGGEPIPLDLAVERLGEVDDTPTLTAYLVVSEAVANALKHARATRIRVGVHEAGDRLVVEVRDDGVGGVTARVDRAPGPGPLARRAARRRRLHRSGHGHPGGPVMRPRGGGLGSLPRRARPPPR